MCRCVVSHFCCNLHFKASIIFLKSALIFFLLPVSLEELLLIIVIASFFIYSFFFNSVSSPASLGHLSYWLCQCLTHLWPLFLFHLSNWYVNLIKLMLKLNRIHLPFSFPPFQTSDPSPPISSPHTYTLIYCSLASTFYICWGCSHQGNEQLYILRPLHLMDLFDPYLALILDSIWIDIYFFLKNLHWLF